MHVSTVTLTRTKGQEQQEPNKVHPDLVTLTVHSDHVPGQTKTLPTGWNGMSPPIIDAFVYVAVLNLSVERS
jgi:hypothetical protein